MMARVVSDGRARRDATLLVLLAAAVALSLRNPPEALNPYLRRIAGIMPRRMKRPNKL